MGTGLNNRRRPQRKVSVFYQVSAAREQISQWLGELLPDLRPENADARLLDAITASEISDLAYVQGSAFDSAIGAHALFPVYVERSERITVPSGFSAVFPVEVEDGPVHVDIEFRCGRPSELKIGERGLVKVVHPRHAVPDVLQNPRISNTSYRLRESNGGRLRSVAGDLGVFSSSLGADIDRAEGSIENRVVDPGQALLYGYVSIEGSVHTQMDADGNLLPRVTMLDILRGYRTYLWAETRAVELHLEFRWSRISASRLRLSVTGRNITAELPAEESKDEMLAGFVLPHMRVRVRGARAAFPALQYADAKRRFLSIESETDRLSEASRRLYEVTQSGCIATQSPRNPSVVSLTTFGVFDTPRETPVRGPAVNDVLRAPDRFLECAGSSSEALRSWVSASWEIVCGVLRSAAEGFDLQHWHRFQWEAIVANLEFLATGQFRNVTVVRAPTSSGKTIVFFVNAAMSALCGRQRSTSILVFPTRLLNEDMFRRLITFVARLRANLPESGVTGGILMGTSDPLYRLLLDPDVGEPMHHYGACPACGSFPMLAFDSAGRVVPRCQSCGYVVDFMYQPNEVAAFLPDVVIATPDKLFYEATASKWDRYSLGLFGARVLQCDRCGRKCAETLVQLKDSWRRCSVFNRGSNCIGTFVGPSTVKPIRYIGFDEVHSLYGETATYLSMFLANLEVLQGVLARQRELPIRYETATATIANELGLLRAITRRAEGDITLIPPERMTHEYFTVEPGTARHRALITMPSKISSKEAFIRAVLNAYRHLGNGSGDLVQQLASHTETPQHWNFLLGYLFKKQEGNDMRRALRDMYRNAFDQELRVDFLSGEAPKDQISRIIQRTLSGDVDILLANLVISLGMDIHGLNHMIMLGVPRSFTEYVQTAGRTGRGRSPGHVQIILQPFYPRDAYLYRHLHAVLSDVAGYYDVLPVRSTNLFCATEMFGNVAKSLISALCVSRGQPQWPHANGIHQTLQGMDGRIQNGITRILCDDPALIADVRSMVDDRFRRLLDELGIRGGFLSEVLTDSETPWIINSLRGRSGSTVRMVCVTTHLLDLLQAAHSLQTRPEAEPDSPEVEGNVE